MTLSVYIYIYIHIYIYTHTHIYIYICQGVKALLLWLFYVVLLWCVVYLCNFRRNEVGRGLKLKQLRAGDSVITVTSHWAPWRLESPASRWLAQPFIRAQIKETSKLRITGLCEGNSPVTGEFPSQMANNAANVSIWWRHHGSLRKIDPNCFVTGLRNANIMRLKYFYSFQYESPLKRTFYLPPCIQLFKCH